MNNYKMINTYVKWKKNSKTQSTINKITNKMKNWNFFLSV